MEGYFLYYNQKSQKVKKVRPKKLLDEKVEDYFGKKELLLVSKLLNSST